MRRVLGEGWELSVGDGSPYLSRATFDIVTDDDADLPRRADGAIVVQPHPFRVPRFAADALEEAVRTYRSERAAAQRAPGEG